MKLDTGEPPAGPLAAPGTYGLRLTAGGRSVDSALPVLPDPRIVPSEADYQAQVAFAERVLAAISRIGSAVEEIRSIRDQVADFVSRLDAVGGQPALVASGRAILAELRGIETKLHNPDAEVVYDILARPGGAQTLSVLTWLYGTGLDDSGFPPTQGQREVFAEEMTKIEALERRLETLKSGELANLEQLARAVGVPRILPPPPAPRR